VDFGDGSSQDVGTLAGPATLTHSYNGPSGSNPATYSAVVNATDINGESTSASVTVGVVPRQPLAVNLAATLGTAVVGKAQSASFTATVTPAVGGADVAKSFTWDFGDNNTATTSGGATTHVYTTQGTMRVTVTVETTDGRTATGRVDLFIAF
jgi:PKD repeat protein